MTEVFSTVMEEARTNPEATLPPPDGKSPLLYFFYGYVMFFTVMAVCTAFLSARGLWPAFVFVFSGLWSRGLHLFSIWAAVFVSAVTLCAEVSGLAEEPEQLITDVSALEGVIKFEILAG